MRYMVYANGVLVDNITSDMPMTAAEYVEECRLNGMEFAPFEEGAEIELVETEG